MAVNTPCKLYEANIGKWRKCRTVVAGEEAVKHAGPAYLPRLTEQLDSDYNAYKERALFYGATGRTVQGLLGAIFRKNPVVEKETDRVKKELKSVTQDFQTAANFATSVVNEILTVGRLGVLVDAPAEAGGVPYLAMYQTESIINWKYIIVRGQLLLSLLVLEETYTEEGEDDFTSKEMKQYRVCELVEGVYQQRLFQPDNKDEDNDDNTTYSEVDGSLVFPTVGNRKLDYIPFQFINSVDTTGNIYDPPILPLANVNLSHYRSSADLEHGRHFTGLPTAWVAGFEKTDIFRVGSQVAWVSEDPEAHAGYLEFTGQGLQSLENALKEKQEMMAVLGARMLEDTKKAVESNSTLSTRYRGENNVLVNISNTVSSGLSVCYTWLMAWRGVTVEIPYSLNSDFVNDRLAPPEIKALMETWQGGAMSWETLFFNYKRGEVYPDDVDMDKEKTKMDNEVPMDIGSYTTAVPEK